LINLGHGANVDDMAAKYNKNPNDILDFSANINPYKIEKLEEYILEGIHKSYNYPDIHYTQLRKNIEEYLGCRSEWIIPGNGATEIMYLLMKCIKGPLAVINPTFSEYERSARLNHVEVVPFYLHKHNSFLIDGDEIRSRINEFESLFICNPNNPTGKVQNIKEILDLLQSHSKLLIVDETFIEFVEDEGTFSLLQYIEDYPNLIIIKAATKFFGLPGIRLGYGITSHQELLKQMFIYKEPWTINSFAENLSNYIFKEQEYIQMTKEFFKTERKRVLNELAAIEHFKTYATDTNFVLIELRSITADQLKKRLFEKYNVLIRDASNFKGLDEHFIRIAIKTPMQNDLLISKLNDECLFEI
jgi:threonine-phosphate decarboxylase